MERLQDIKVIVCKARVPEKPFWDEGEWIGEVLFAVVDSPMVYSDDRLVQRQWSGQCHLRLTLTFSGTYSPRILLPFRGTTRGSPAGTGGYIRSASFRQASI